MTDLDVDLDGGLDLQETLDDLIDDYTDAEPYLVGTAVEYAIYVEFGRGPVTPTDAEALRFEGEDGETVFAQRVGPQEPHPFVRPAVAEAQADVERFVERHTRTTLRAADTADEVVQLVAFALERAIKQNAPVDTGTLRASVRAVEGTSAARLPDADDVDIAAETTRDIDFD